MPRTGTLCSPLLGIRLEGNQPSYSPGDTIIGSVFRQNHAVSAKATITISLSGRTKTKLVVSNGNNTTTYRGRFNLIPENAHRQKIFEGPLHIEVGGDAQAWPFALTLPKYVDPKHLQNGDQNESYLPLGATDYVLPSTYTYPTAGSTEAFVEYVLSATLRLRGKSDADAAQATLPIKKFKQVLQSTSVPQFAFSLFVGLPTIIQLDNPNPIPFKLRIIPNRDTTSEVIRDVPQQVKLTFVSVRIATLTEVMCEGTFSPHTKEKNNEVDLCVMNALSGFKDGLYIPCSSKSPPLDIGEMIDLRLGCFGPGYPRRLGGGYMSFDPSFTTYNIRQTYRLKWEVKGTLAGEEFKRIGTVPVKLLAPSDVRRSAPLHQNQIDPIGRPTVVGESSASAGPSQMHRNESWIQPPDEDEAPPSFTQAVKDDAATRPPEKVTVL
ncbi:hypothetical protein ACLX1H_006172 [Fusarium chlamydosporum]